MSLDGSPAQQSKTERLKRMARPLKPERPPFYVQNPRPDAPLMGWWWQPAGAQQPIPLAASFDAAIVNLSTQLQVPA